jgi:hypothetical protein
MDLREKIVELLKWHNCYGMTSTTIAKQILDLFEGWKSPEEVEQEMNNKCYFCLTGEEYKP